MSLGRALGKKLLERASGKVVEALERADALGGRVRDRVVEKLDSLKPPPAPVARPAAAAPVAIKPPPTGLGDPGRPVQVFGRESCPWSGRAIALLERTLTLNPETASAAEARKALEIARKSVPSPNPSVQESPGKR